MATVGVKGLRLTFSLPTPSSLQSSAPLVLNSPSIAHFHYFQFGVYFVAGTIDFRL